MRAANMTAMTLALAGAPAWAAGAPTAITTPELVRVLGKPGWKVVDARATDAFNGWRLDGVDRGGHIRGATDFSAAWLAPELRSAANDALLRQRLAQKGLTPDQHVVVYDANGQDAPRVAAWLKEQGIRDVRLYDVRGWARGRGLPMARYAHYETLVPASWVRELITGGRPEGYDGQGYLLFEVSWGNLKNAVKYLAGHIPGAVHIDTDEIESAPLWSLHPDPALLAFAAKNGITGDRTVVLYGDDVMAAYRLAAILRYLGVKDVRVLNGGHRAWTRAGYALERGTNPKRPVAAFGAKAPRRKGLVVDLAGAKRVLGDPKHAQLVDVRSWAEHVGEVSGYGDMDRKGRPAGCVWGRAGTSATSLEDYRNVDHTMRNGEEILAMWRAQGVDPAKRLVFFCGSGWRAAEVLTYAEVLGVKDAALYSNGWYEWSLDPRNPRAIGKP